MSTPRDVLQSHAQHYPNSCAASGMEMLLKLHDLEHKNFRGFQDRYRNTNIGFEKLADLLRYSIKAKDHEPLLEEGFAKIEVEARAGRFPLVSLKGSIKWHIWIAVIEDNRLRFLSKDFMNPDILELENDFKIRQPLVTHRQGKLHFATYDVEE